MRVIYEPKGMAREYAELATNPFTGCAHGCLYCYGPSVKRTSREAWKSNVAPRVGYLTKLAADCEELEAAGDTRTILLSFMTDVFQSDATAAVTVEALEIIGRYGLNATILTKGGLRAEVAFSTMVRWGFAFGTSLCFASDMRRRRWEPGAASIASRMEAVKWAKERGLQTWLSIEPVIYPDEALAVIDQMNPFINEWKIGKLNHDKKREATIDWADFLERVEKFTRSLA